MSSLVVCDTIIIESKECFIVGRRCSCDDTTGTCVCVCVCVCVERERNWMGFVEVLI